MSTDPLEKVKADMKKNLSPEIKPRRDLPNAPSQRTMGQSWLGMSCSFLCKFLYMLNSNVLYLCHSSFSKTHVLQFYFMESILKAIPRRTRLFLSFTLFGTALAGLWVSDKLEEKLPAAPEQKAQNELPTTAAKI